MEVRVDGPLSSPTSRDRLQHLKQRSRLPILVISVHLHSLLFWKRETYMLIFVSDFLYMISFL